MAENDIVRRPNHVLDAPRLRRRTALALPAICLAAHSGASRAQTPRRPSGRRGQVVLGLSQEPTRFHPLQARIEVDEGVQHNLFDALWRVEPDGRFSPNLAIEVPSVENGGLSADGLTWRIRLKSGVLWHDGRPFTAEDVKFTLELLQNPDFPAFTRNGHTLVRDITVVSPTEITWRMERFFAPYFSMLAWTLIVPKHVPGAGAMTRDAGFNNAPIGTGPFKWGERRPGDYIRLDANERYHGDGPYLERIVFKYIPDQTVLKTQFVGGAIDAVGLAGITPDHHEEVRRTRGITLQVVPTSFLQSFMFNNGLPVFQDAAVRRALYLALDKQTVLRELFYGFDRPTESFLPHENWAYHGNLPAHRYDMAEAGRVLDQAGWRRGAGGVREKSGVRLSFECSTVVGSHLREQMQQFLQQAWQPLGVQMTIRNFPAAVMWGDFWRRSQFQTTIVGAIFPIAGDPDVSDRVASWAIPVRAGSGSNTMQYANAEVDTLLRDSVGLLDREQRKRNYQRVQEIVRNDMPYLPLFQANTAEGTKAGLQGYRANVNYRSNAWNMREWFWAS